MGHAVFIHRPDSNYDDIPSERYQFPRQYLGRVRQCTGHWIVYLEPSKIRDTRGYFAVARVQDVIPDPRLDDMFLAIIKPGSYLDFGDPVPFRVDGDVIERGVLNAAGRISGRAQSAVRPLSPADFAAIVDRGLGGDDILPRSDELETFAGLEEPQASYDAMPVEARAVQLTSRAVRDRNFRKTVLRAYDERCAISGLRLINGGGRAEAEAAHIRPVDHGGPDIISNGIALSGTAHWMFDRGLVGLGDDLTILISRQVNDPAAAQSLINPSGALLAPARTSDRPRPEFLAWHREHVFKH